MANTKERCSFCGKAKNEVKHNVLVAATDNGPWICLRCIDDSKRAIEENVKRDAAHQDEPLKRPAEIKAYLDQFVIGQDRAKTDVSLAIYNHYKRREVLKRGGSLTIEIEGEEETVEIDKSNILLLGPSGTGKTHIARGIARMLKVPFYVADATRLTMSGYVGDDVESILQGLIAAADQDIDRAQWGIAFIDEIDKLARKTGRGASGYRDVTGEGVQQSLLKLLEGSQVPVPRGMGSKAIVAGAGGADMIDTSNILFIGAGSFAGIEECVEKRVNKGASMGFGAHERKRFDALDKTSIYSQVIEDDLLDFGMIPELLGRLPVLTSTIDLTEDQMVEVLMKPKNSIVKQFRALYKMDGVDLQFDDAALRAIARDAKRRPTGARALRSIVERVLQPYSFEVPNDPTISAIRVTEEVVKGTGKPVYVKRDVKATA